MEEVEAFVKTQLTEVCATVENWKKLPWEVVRSPVEVSEKMPSFVFVELLFALLALSCFVHSYKKGRTYILVWWASILVGCANDAIFMFLPGVDNFFHAQGTIMLTPRLPLYILFVYNSFMYLSVVSGFQLKLGMVANSAVVGLLAELVYCCYDLLGVKLLWWTWHDTDIAVSQRIFDVPIGSTMWVITFASSFYFLLNILSFKIRRIGWFQFVLITIALCLFTTPLMMLQMGFFQVLGVMGCPNELSLLLLILVYLLVISLKMIYSGNWLQKRFNPAMVDGFLSGVVNIYFSCLAFIGFYFSSEVPVSEGVHQVLGACGVKELDLSGMVRDKFLCATGYDEQFRIHGTASGELQWYTISGVPNEYHDVWIIIICTLGLLGITAFTYMFTATAPTPKNSGNVGTTRTPSMNPINAKKVSTNTIPKPSAKPTLKSRAKKKKNQ